MIINVNIKYCDIIQRGDIMSITGENIHKFKYIDFETNSTLPKEIEVYITRRIISVESKHVADLRDNTEKFFEYSKKVGYMNTILGNHRNSSIKNEYARIKNMSASECERAIRFVITKDERLWSDNTHWALAYLLKYGLETTLLDIPAYIIDFRDSTPVVFDKSGVVFDSVFDIKSSIASANRIQERLTIGWRPLEVSYTIKNLYNDILSIISLEC